jgi:hypothetical protein
MKRKNWICSACADVMTKSSDGFMACLCSGSRLRPLWSVIDLPLARRYDYRRFQIHWQAGCDGSFWEYVPHTHAGCMDRAPEPDHVVAKTICNRYGGVKAMTFRPCSPPRTAT